MAYKNTKRRRLPDKDQMDAENVLHKKEAGALLERRKKSRVSKDQHVTINFRLSKSKAKTHPIQILVSLNSRFQSLGYKKVIQNLYITVPIIEWDNKRKRFKNDPEKNILLTVLAERLKISLNSFLIQYNYLDVYPDSEFKSIKAGIQNRILTALESTKLV